MSSITLSVLRGEVGKTFSGWQAQEVTGTFNAPRLVIQCQSCGNRMNVDVNQWYSITQGREWRCSNASGHRAETKAVPQAQPLSREILDRMPSDEFKRRMLSEPGFEEQANAIYNSGPKQLNYREAQEQRAAREKAARMGPARKIFTNAYHAYEAAGEVAPTFDQWLALDNETRQSIIDRFDLTRVDYKAQELGKVFGRSN